MVICKYPSEHVNNLVDLYFAGNADLAESLKESLDEDESFELGRILNDFMVIHSNKYVSTPKEAFKAYYDKKNGVEVRTPVFNFEKCSSIDIAKYLLHKVCEYFNFLYLKNAFGIVFRDRIPEKFTMEDCRKIAFRSLSVQLSKFIGYRSGKLLIEDCEVIWDSDHWPYCVDKLNSSNIVWKNCVFKAEPLRQIKLAYVWLSPNHDLVCSTFIDCKFPSMILGVQRSRPKRSEDYKTTSVSRFVQKDIKERIVNCSVEKLQIFCGLLGDDFKINPDIILDELFEIFKAPIITLCSNRIGGTLSEILKLLNSVSASYTFRKNNENTINFSFDVQPKKSL